jgi:hypothetical protein
LFQIPRGSSDRIGNKGGEVDQSTFKETIMATRGTGIITIAERQIAKPDEAWIDSSVTGLLERRGKR